MGRANGYEKAQRATDRIVNKLDREGNATGCQPNTEGVGELRIYRGRLFRPGYIVRGEQGRVFIPEKKGE